MLEDFSFSLLYSGSFPVTILQFYLDLKTDIWVGSFAATMSKVTPNSLEHVILVCLGFGFASLFLFETSSYHVVQVSLELAYLSASDPRVWGLQACTAMRGTLIHVS